MNICFSVNSAYVKYLCVCLTSLFRNDPGERITVRVFYMDLEAEECRMLEELAASFSRELFCIRADRELFAEFRPEPYPTEAYLRLCMPYLLPEEIDRMLYLDVDTIVEKPLADFYRTDLKDLYAAVCTDLKLIEGRESREEGPAGSGRCGERKLIRDKSGSYFNSGVMLCNLKKIREDFRFEDFVRFARARDFDLPYADQDILNDAFTGKVLYADPDRYNYLVNMEHQCGYDERLASEAVILHYAGCCPWHRVKVAPSHRRWWYYAKQTPFYKELLERKLKGTDLPGRLR